MNFKKVISVAAMALSLGAVGVHAQEPVIEGSSYYLPKTALHFTLLVEKSEFAPGELADYAARYMKLNDAVLDAKVSYRLLDLKMEPVGVPDTTKYYTAHVSPKLNLQKVYTTPDGILRAVNVMPDEEKPAARFTPGPRKKVLDPHHYMNQDILSAGSRAKTAELCAEEINEIRSARNELTRGTAETMPKDGEQLHLMLDALKEQEGALMQVFEGVTICDTVQIDFTVRYDAEEERRCVFRFSDRYGYCEGDDLSGDPYYVVIEDLHQTPEDLRTEKEKAKQKDETGLYVNVPGRARVYIYKEENKVMERDIPYAQFGRVENVSPLLFSKKVFTSYKTSPITGVMMELNSEEVNAKH